MPTWKYRKPLFVPHPDAKELRGPGGLTIILDRREIFPDDPGQGTPAMVYLYAMDRRAEPAVESYYSATYWCACGEGAVGGEELDAHQLEWLDRQEAAINAFLYPLPAADKKVVDLTPTEVETVRRHLDAKPAPELRTWTVIVFADKHQSPPQVFHVDGYSPGDAAERWTRLGGMSDVERAFEHVACVLPGELQFSPNDIYARGGYDP